MVCAAIPRIHRLITRPPEGAGCSVLNLVSAGLLKLLDLLNRSACLAALAALAGAAPASSLSRKVRGSNFVNPMISSERCAKLHGAAGSRQERPQVFERANHDPPELRQSARLSPYPESTRDLFGRYRGAKPRLRSMT